MLELVEIRILGLPVDVSQRAAEHNDELMREFALIRGQDTSDEAVPARLLTLVDELRARYAGFTTQPEADLSDAAAAGRTTIDLVYLVPPAAASGAAELDDLLDEADSFCQAGDLLTLTTPPETLAFRRWFLREFVRQAAGEPPAPWPG
ncbi:MAG: hypothetical protein QOJ69_766 [Actinomycetota bacterium]|jgi:hypothetical protein|nr:hypothetical protein [Actinomycetota bacterium]